MVKQRAGAPDIVHLPSRGMGPAINDLVGGQILLAISVVSAPELEMNQAGKLRILHDHPSAGVDPRVHDPSYDLTVCKKGPSIFFNTGVAEYFNKERVDTVIVTGCNTSGCIRATAVDSFSYRYRTIVPEDCVGDIEEQPHRDNLRDIGRRYVDVSDLVTVLAYLEEWRKSNA